MFSCTLQPAGDGSFAVVGAAHEYRDVTTFSQEHPGQDDVAFVGLESIQRRVQATGETLVAPLAFPVLDVFADAAFSITNKCMNAMISDPKVFTFGIGTGVTLG